MAEDKRMAGDYAIIQSMIVGGTEVVIGENPAAEPGQRYMCAYGTHSDMQKYLQYHTLKEHAQPSAAGQRYQQNQRLRRSGI